jgi:CBS domain-containing protein
MESDFPSVPDKLALTDYSDRLARGDSLLSKRQGTILLDDRGRLSGIITRGDVVRALRADKEECMSVLDAGSKDVVVTYPEEPLQGALTKMLSHNIGRLPVVDHSEPTRVVGYLGRAAILSACFHVHQSETVRQRG